MLDCVIAKIFLRIFYSRIDNTRVNFTLGIPEAPQFEKFSVRFRNSICL
jgi:hypothetical protein